MPGLPDRGDPEAWGGGAMDAIDLQLDARLFSCDVVTRAAHRYSGEFFVELVSEADVFVVRLTPKTHQANTDQLAERFRNDVLDESLRERMRAETSQLRDTLIQAALQQARPAESGPQS